MFVLTCPSCGHPTRVKFARLGATATCGQCKGLFKVEAHTLRSNEHSATAPPQEPSAVERQAVVQTAVARSDIAPLPQRPPSRRPAAPTVARHDPPPPYAIMSVAGVALVAALVVWLLTAGSPPADTAAHDVHPLPPPLASTAERMEELPADAPPGEHGGPPRVRLVERSTALAQESAADLVPMEPVYSRMGISESGDGAQTLILAIRNMTTRPVRDPQFAIDLTDDSGAVLRSWRGSVRASIPPGQMFEFEALPPGGMMSPPAGRLVLRAYATPSAAKP